MYFNLNQICDYIEWRIEATRVVGSLKMYDHNAARFVKIRLEGFPHKERRRKLAEAQIAVAIDIVKDIFDGRLLESKQLSERGVAAEPREDDPAPQPRTGGRRNKKTTAGPSSGKKVRAGGETPRPARG